MKQRQRDPLARAWDDGYAMGQRHGGWNGFPLGVIVGAVIATLAALAIGCAPCEQQYSDYAHEYWERKHDACAAELSKCNPECCEASHGE